MGVNAFRTTSSQAKPRRAKPVPVKETMEETAMIAFTHVTKLWEFDEEQKIAALGLKNVGQLKDLQKNPNSLTEKQMIKISYLYNIYRALRSMIGNKEVADDWLRHTHEKKIVFGGNNKTPLQSVLSGDTNDLKELCNCLAEFRTF